MREGAKPRTSRKHSGTANWHMSREPVSLSIPELNDWSDKECHDFLVQVRFGSMDTVSCPHCGTVGRHYWRILETRWKCMGCGSTFSVTSKTVFSKRKKSLRHILTSVLLWLNSSAGQPALELKRHMDTTYNTAFILQHKLREALVRGHNVGLLNGDVEIDGAHQSGWHAARKRGVPRGSQPLAEDADEAAVTAVMLTQTGKQSRRKKKKEGRVNSEFGQVLPGQCRIMFAVRQRSGVRGKGARLTRIAVGLAETGPIADAVLKSFVALPESFLNTDSSPAYTAAGKQSRGHFTVEHGKELSGKNGENNNQAEELNGRFDRAEKGIYLNIEPKYLLDYAVETAFRSDARRIPNGEQLKLAMSVALSVGPSQFWTGFTRGHHRTVELLCPQPQFAHASGPAKGRHPISSANGRPPR